MKEIIFKETKKSFYYILNADLRSGDKRKIQRYVEFFAKINEYIRNGGIMSYENTARSVVLACANEPSA